MRSARNRNSRKAKSFVTSFSWAYTILLNTLEQEENGGGCLQLLRAQPGQEYSFGSIRPVPVIQIARSISKKVNCAFPIFHFFIIKFLKSSSIPPLDSDVCDVCYGTEALSYYQ